MWARLYWLRVFRKLNLVLRNQEIIMSALEDLTSEVAKVETSVDAAVAAIQKGSNDSAQLADLTARLAAAQAKLDAATASST